MMYSQNFVVAVLHNGHFVDETKDGVVALPFGAEYTLRLRNRNNRRAVASVTIDDEHMGDIVVSAHHFVDLETSAVHPGRKFLFASSDSEAAIDAGKNNRTDRSNGVVRVEWKLEKEHHFRLAPLTQFRSRSYTQPPTYGEEKTCGGMQCNNSTKGLDTGQQLAGGYEASPRGLSEGCTVEGSYSSQGFHEIHMDLESGPGVVIQIVLRGYSDKYNVAGRFCANCGEKVSKQAKYCNNCGMFLQKEVHDV
jgi:hypothetical protein